MNRITTLILTTLLVLAAMVGCQRKVLLDPHDHYNLIIKANFDDHALSQLLSNKSDGYSKPGEPVSTKYIFYEKNSQKIAYRGTFDGREGGVYLQEGIYDMLLYTSDFNELDANFYRGLDNPLTAETYTRQNPLGDASPRNDVTEVYMVEPDPTFSILRKEIVVLDGYEDQLIEVYFDQKSFKYYLTIKATGLHNIHTATMNISGMYTSAFLTSEEHRMNEAGMQTVDLDIRIAADSEEGIGRGELYGEFWSFGPNQREDITHSITLHFVNGDVITMKLKEDLTSQIKELTRGGEIIVREVVEIKGPAGGFQPGVGDWNDTDVDIEL